MLRTAGRGGLLLAGSVAAAAHYQDRASRCSALSSTQRHDYPTTATTTILPTLQALNRARRLARTVALVVWDYEGPATAPSSDLRAEIARLRRVLEEEQAVYTADDAAFDADVQKARVRAAAAALGAAEDASAGDGGDPTHVRAARRLLDLCRENGGVYIKIGQHLANLDYLIPSEYVDTLAALYDNAPVSSYESVREVIREELGAYPEDVFASFEETPLASASLAQVHVAVEKDTGRRLAVKVQHRGLRETSVGDILALEAAVSVIDRVFTDFTWAWLSEEITPQLPLELDFANEGRNAEKAASHLKQTGLDCIVPEIIWDKTTSRVLCMQFEEGFNSTSLKDIDDAGLDKRDIAKLISSVFNAQVFQSGFVHCDPHPANVLVRQHPTKKRGVPQMVLVDHGLYKQIDDDFRVTYAQLWKSLLMADIGGIKAASKKLGIGKMFPLLAGMLTSRPFDETIERSKSGSFEASSKAGGGAGDKAMIQGYAQRYIKEIFSLLDLVPRQMLLLFKMNDCLRHVDFALGSPTNTLVVAGRYAAEAVYRDAATPGTSSCNNGTDIRTPTSRLGRVRHWMEYAKVILRIQVYELAIWWSRYVRPSFLSISN